MSELKPDVSSSSQIGVLLREARCRLGEDLQSAADALRIRPIYLQAIEDGRFGDLPGAVYAAGFVRSYADHLGLDGKEVVRRFKNEIADGLAKRSSLVFPSPVSEGRLPGIPMMLLGLLLAAAAYGGWYYLSSDKLRVAELVTPAPESVKPQVAEPPVAPAPPPVDSVVMPPEPAPPPTERTDMVPPADGEGDDVTPALPATSAAGNIERAPPPATKTKEEPPAAAPTVPAVPEDVGTAFVGRVYGQVNSGSRVTLRAIEDAWIQIREPNGDLLLARLLAKGDSYRVPDRPGLSLVTGNAGGLEVLVDGKAAPRLGQVGIVRRDVVLDADALMGAAR